MAVVWVRCVLVSIGLGIVLSLCGDAHAQPDEIAALNQRISELYRAGKYSEAIPLAERSLELTRTQKGEAQFDTANGMGWLATLYQAQGRYAEAELLYKRDLAITEKALGPDHPAVGTVVNNLAGLYHDQGRYAEVEPLYKRSL